MSAAEPAPAPGKPPASTAAKLVLFASSTWLRLALTLCVGIVLTPMLIGRLGSDLFGLFFAIAFTVALSDPVQMTLAKALTREMTGAVTAGGGRRLQEAFSSGVVIALGGACVTLLIPTLFATFATTLFRFDPADALRVRTAILAEGAIIVAAVVAAPWSNLYLATHRIIFHNLGLTVARALDLVAALLAFFVFRASDPFLGFVLTRAALRVAQTAGWALRARALVPDARINLGMVRRSTLRTMIFTGGWSTADQAARFGLYVSDHFLVNWFFGPVYNGINAIVNQLVGYARLPGSNLTFGVDVISTDLHERGAHATLRRLLVGATKHTFALSGFCAVVMGLFAGPLIDVWLKAKLEQDAPLLAVMPVEEGIRLTWAFVAVMLPGMVIAEAHMAASNILYGMGKIREYAVVFIAAGALKVVAALIVLRSGVGFLGEPLLALPATTVAVLFLLFGVYFPLLIRRVARVRLRDLVWNAYIRPTLSLAPVFAAGWWIVHGVERWTLLTLALAVGSLGALWAPLVFAVALDREERGRVLDVGRRALARVGAARGRAQAASPAPAHDQPLAGLEPLPDPGLSAVSGGPAPERGDSAARRG